MHRHADLRLVLFIAGEVTETTFGGSQRFTRGDFIFRPAHFAHADCAGASGAAYAQLSVSVAAARRWFGRYGWRAARGRVELCEGWSGDDLLATALPDAYTTTTATCDMQRVAKWLERASTPIHEAAMRLRIAPYQLTRRFHAAFGMTPNAYRRMARLQRAICMLCEDGGTPAEIAAAAGFHDQSHLTAELKRETRSTPSALRRKMQGA